MSPVQRYILISNDSLAIHRWKNEGVIFVKKTGDTHLVGEIGLKLLDLLRTQCLSVDDLATQLIEYDLDLMQINSIVESLEKQEIVEKCWQQGLKTFPQQNFVPNWVEMDSDFQLGIFQSV